MATLHFREARECVLEKVGALRSLPAIEDTVLDDAAGRVLAEPVRADRDYPPSARSIRDGFALRSADAPGRLRVIGEVRAGQAFASEVGPGEAVEIMTGAPVPHGADAVAMIEHVTRKGDQIVVPECEPGQFVNPQASEARKGDELLAAGRRIGYSEIAVLAAAGKAAVRVYRRPRVAVLATGDEIVEVTETPLAHQVRNSNAHSLAAQVRRAGAIPQTLPVARDRLDATRALIERGLAADLLLLSGGVSAGKYDVVEQALASFGAEFYFDRVLIQPGQPLVFGRARGTFFFGLPGNPVSTMVTFELFARAALDLLSGQTEAPLPLVEAVLAEEFRHKPGLTRFLPARVDDQGRVRRVAWRGSSDIAAVARANAFLVADEARECWRAGEPVPVLLK